MKFSQVILLAALTAGLAAGCTRKPKNITPMPANERIGGQPTSRINSNGPILPGDGASGPRDNIPPRGSSFPNTRGPQGTDLNSPGSGQLGGNNPAANPNPQPVDRSDTAQTDRENWASRAQDPDTLRGDTIYFDFDKSTIKRSETAKVAAIAEHLKGHPGFMLKVDGHADERGTEEYNRALGERRALAVREMLLNLGIPADSVVTASFGEDRPAELGHNEAAWAKNRRAEPVLLLPPGTTR